MTMTDADKAERILQDARDSIENIANIYEELSELVL